MADVAERTGASLLLLESVVWKRLNDKDYFLARPLSEADLVINLPKLKTHSLTLYTGAVKNMFGAVPGPRKRQVHYLAPGVPDFSRALVDVLELTRPGLTILDGVLGQEGWGPGLTGTPRRYRLVAASTDPVALDAVVAQALGYRPGDVLHLAQAEARGLGVASRERITVVGDAGALRFGAVRLPVAWWFLQLPAWVAAPLRPATRMQPRLIPSACLGCGSCAAVCPRRAITPGRPPRLDMDRCVGCLCCVEVCPEGAIAPRRSLLARLFAVGG
jgi:NAD-dependent dihydropyrimidine dehydrogenase PreA subunit